MPISFSGLSGGGGKIEVTKDFTSTTSWTCPDDVTEITAILYGGGGGGAKYNSDNSASIGGSGSALEKVISVTPGASYTITIGAGGSASNNEIGVKGGSTSIGNLVSVPGGSAGVRMYNVNFQTNQTQTTSGGRGGVMLSSNAVATLNDAGKGLYGRGGGGGVYSNIDTSISLGADGGGFGDKNDNTFKDGAPNFGGGGASGQQGQLAGSGGSGFVRIKYWTAE